MQAAVDGLWMYTGELFHADATEQQLAARASPPTRARCEAPWRAHVDAVFAEATLAVPQGVYMQGVRRPGGKAGVHTEHLGHLLAEMQFLQRAYPTRSGRRAPVRMTTPW